MAEKNCTSFVIKHTRRSVKKTMTADAPRELKD